MHRFKRLSFFVIVPLAAACAQGATLEGIGGSGRGGGTPVDTGGTTGTGATPTGTGGTSVSTSSSSSSGNGSSSGSTSSGDAPTTCTKAGGYEGCCVGTTLYYCSKGSTSVSHDACPSGQACGWSSSKGYYSCVAPPGEADPGNEYPMACQ